MHECEYCGGPLERFEGETYCPDCCCWEAVQLAERAGEEARALHRHRPAQLPDPDGGDGIPW